MAGKKSKKEPVKQAKGLPSNAHITGAGEVEHQLITDTLRENYMPYAMSVIMSRAIPEIDGFKPSHRKLVNTVDLTESEISKIELIVSDAEINIIGRSEKACIEFVNFRENYYNLSAANRVLSFSEIPDITSMLKFWENGFTFKGMRYRSRSA